MTEEVGGPPGSGHRLPVFALAAFPPAVLSVLVWAGLEHWAEPLGYAAPAAVALAIVATVLMLVFGAVSAVVGILRGERPLWVAVLALLANAAAAAWLRGNV